MKNNLSDLNNYLFEELERLNDNEYLTKETSLEEEIARSKAISSVAQVIVNNANIVLKAVKLQDEREHQNNQNINKLLGNKSE